MKQKDDDEKFVIVRIKESDYKRLLREQELKQKNQEYRKQYYREHYCEPNQTLKPKKPCLPPIDFEVLVTGRF